MNAVSGRRSAACGSAVDTDSMWNWEPFEFVHVAYVWGNPRIGATAGAGDVVIELRLAAVPPRGRGSPKVVVGAA
jgi:hypothetical protein